MNMAVKTNNTQTYTHVYTILYQILFGIASGILHTLEQTPTWEPRVNVGVSAYSCLEFIQCLCNTVQQVTLQRNIFGESVKKQ